MYGTDAPTQHAVLRNIANLVTGLPTQCPVEVGVHGPAVRFLAAVDRALKALDTFAAAGVIFLGRANSMRSLANTAAELRPGTTVVPSGVVHLVLRQH